MAKTKEVKKEADVINMAAAVREMEAAPNVEGTKEAPSKRELTDAEKALHQRRVILQKTGEAQDKMHEVIEGMKAKDYHLFAYEADAVVEIPGQMFADLLNLVAAFGGHISNEKAMLNDMVVAGESLYLGAFQAQLDLTDLHIANCEAGITSSPAEMAKVDEAAAKADAEKNINLVDKNTKKPKATGTILGDEESVDPEDEAGQISGDGNITPEEPTANA